jgi:hypothetical protein
MLKRYVGSLSLNNHKAVYSTLTEKFDKLFNPIEMLDVSHVQNIDSLTKQSSGGKPDLIEEGSTKKSTLKSIGKFTAPTLNIVNRSHIQINSVNTLNKSMQTRENVSEAIELKPLNSKDDQDSDSDREAPN